MGDIKRFEVDLNGKKVTIAYVLVYSEDDNEEYPAFLTDEALEVLDQYLDFRRIFHEEITPESPLFRLEHNLREAKKDPEKRKTAITVKPATNSAIKGQIQKALEASGLRVRNFKMQHGFRFRFKTILEESPLKSVYIEALLGHSTSDADPDGYLKADPEDLGAQFARVMSLLYVSEGRTGENQDFRATGREG